MPRHSSMETIIKLWCPKEGEAHQFPLQLDFFCGQEEVEVRGNIPQHCPVCDQSLTQLEQDGLLMDVGEEADKIINRMYPGIYLRMLPMEVAV